MKSASLGFITCKIGKGFYSAYQLENTVRFCVLNIICGGGLMMFE